MISIPITHHFTGGVESVVAIRILRMTSGLILSHYPFWANNKKTKNLNGHLGEGIRSSPKTTARQHRDGGCEVPSVQSRFSKPVQRKRGTWAK